MDEPTPPTTPNGYSRLARRITGWTSNLLASAAVLVAGLVIGREVVQWLALDAARSSVEKDAFPKVSAAIPNLANPYHSHRLGFGGRPAAIRRKGYVGNQQEMLAALRQECRTAVEGAADFAREPGPQELKLLAQVSLEKPVEEELGRWRMYQLNEPIAMTLIVSAVNKCVMCWGLALPVGREGKEWTLFAMPVAATSGKSASADHAIAAPPFGRPLISLRSADGATMIVLTGEGPLARWQEYLDGWLQQSHWRVVTPWQHSGNLLVGRFAREAGEETLMASIADGTEITVMLAFSPSKVE